MCSSWLTLSDQRPPCFIFPRAFQFWPPSSQSAPCMAENSYPKATERECSTCEPRAWECDLQSPETPRMFVTKYILKSRLRRWHHVLLLLHMRRRLVERWGGSHTEAGDHTLAHLLLRMLSPDPHPTAEGEGMAMGLFWPSFNSFNLFNINNFLSWLAVLFIRDYRISALPFPCKVEGICFLFLFLFLPCLPSTGTFQPWAEIKQDSASTYKSYFF